MEDKPAKKPCGRHAYVGREYDDGCYACRRDYLDALSAWVQHEYLATQIACIESIFVREVER